MYTKPLYYVWEGPLLSSAQRCFFVSDTISFDANVIRITPICYSLIAGLALTYAVDPELQILVMRCHG